MVVNYAATVKPMTQLLKKNTEFVWLPEHQKSFEEIRDFICKAPCLKFPNYNKGFIVATDASYKGIGGVLCQRDEQGKEIPIAYTSRSLTKAEKNYSVTDIESLALVVCLKKFRSIIFGFKVEVITDHKPLIHIMENKDLSLRPER